MPLILAQQVCVATMIRNAIRFVSWVSLESWPNWTDQKCRRLVKTPESQDQPSLVDPLSAMCSFTLALGD